MKFFESDNKTALESLEYAQRIAFAPVAFQAARALRNSGLLAMVNNGITLKEAVKKSKLPLYGVRVLFEAGLGIGLLFLKNEKYFLTKTGSFILNDKMTTVNMDFVHDVCYKGLFYLETAVKKGVPEGLKNFGKWKTVYEALQHLPAQFQKSWYAFDHFYSDVSFKTVLPFVFSGNPKKILDIGGNTGKFAEQCLSYSKKIHLGIADLPGQLKHAKRNLGTKRVSFHELNIKKSKLPEGYDVIWMSQFLDCFSEKEIVFILKKCYSALKKNGSVFILEPFWDRQKFAVSSFCLQMTSLYFTAIANGNSQMYHSELFRKLVGKSGFTIVEQIDNIGVSHSLLKCRKK